MQTSADYPTFVCIVVLGVMTWLSHLNAFVARLKADDAMQCAYRAHRRLDRMQKAAKPTDRETLAVSYSQGFQVRDSWEDDFHRTQLVRDGLKPSLRKRVVQWILY
jgi:hypothetical protein